MKFNTVVRNILRENEYHFPDPLEGSRMIKASDIPVESDQRQVYVIEMQLPTTKDTSTWMWPLSRLTDSTCKSFWDPYPGNLYQGNNFKQAINAADVFFYKHLSEFLKLQRSASLLDHQAKKYNNIKADNNYFKARTLNYYSKFIQECKKTSHIHGEFKLMFTEPYLRFGVEVDKNAYKVIGHMDQDVVGF
jgi:hypothetical protein